MVPDRKARWGLPVVSRRPLPRDPNPGYAFRAGKWLRPDQVLAGTSPSVSRIHSGIHLHPADPSRPAGFCAIADGGAFPNRRNEPTEWMENASFSSGIN